MVDESYCGAVPAIVFGFGKIQVLKRASPNTRRTIEEHIPRPPNRFDDVLDGFGVREVLVLRHVVDGVVAVVESRG